MRKWYNFETMFRSLADELSWFLKVSNIKYERSGCFDGYHFELLCDDTESEAVDNWLEAHTITER